MNQYRIENNINWFQKYSGNSQYVKRMLKNLEYIYSQNYRDSVQVKNGSDVVGTDKADDNVQTMINHYFGRSVGNKNDEKYESWCAIFIWNMVNELCGFDFNIVPDPETEIYNASVGKKTSIWGNAKLTAQALQENKRNVAADTTPAIGCAFFRLPYSARTGKKSGASGHMGFVIGINDSSIFTIEGNAAVIDEDTTSEMNPNGKHVDGIMCYEYSKSEITSLGFQFLHLEKYYDTKIAQGELAQCFPPETKPNDPPVKSCPPPSVYNFVTGECDQPEPDEPGEKPKTKCVPPDVYNSITGVCEPPKKTPPTDKVTPPTTKKTCDEIISIKIPCNPSDVNCTTILPYWRILQNDPAVAMDIIEHGGVHGVIDADRNGAALGYKGKDQDTQRMSGLGFFRTQSGKNTIYILKEGAAGTEALLRQQLIPYPYQNKNMDVVKAFYQRDAMSIIADYPNAIVAQSTYDKAGQEGESKNQQVDALYLKDTGQIRLSANTVNNWLARFDKPNKIVSVHSILIDMLHRHDGVTMDGSSRWYVNTNRLLETIEQNESKITAPGPIILFFEKFEKKTWMDTWGDAISFISALSGFVPGLGQYVQYLKPSIEIVNNISTNGFQNLSSILKSAYGVAQLMAPDTIKGLEKEVSAFGDSVGQYLKTASNGFESAITGKASEIEKFLKVEANIVKQYKDRYEQAFSQSITPLLNATKNPDMFGVKNTMQNLSNMLLTRKIGKTIESKLLLQSLVGSDLMSTPIMQDLFIINDNNGILSGIPGIGDIAGTIISHGTLADAGVALDEYAQSHSYVAFARAALGYHVESKDMTALAYSALQKQGLDAMASAGIYVMPNVNPENIDCFRIELEKDGIKTAYCPPGWIWDSTTQKCKNNSTVGWVPETGGSIGGGKIDLGCPPGYYSDGKGNCIKERGECPPGTIWNDKTQKCEIVTKCPDGSTWNEATQKCEFPIECPDGYMLKDGKCVPYVRECPSGTVWNETTQKCEIVNQKVKIPKCIIIIDGKYFYNVQWENQVIISPEVPVKKSEVDYVTATGNSNAVTGKLTAEQSATIKGSGFVDLPTAPKKTNPIVEIVKTPAISKTTTTPAVVDLDSILNITPKTPAILTQSTKEVSVSPTIAAPKKYSETAMVEAPQFYGYSLGDSDYWEAVVKDQGLPTERWFTLKPGTMISLFPVKYSEDQWVEIDKNCGLMIKLYVKKVECPENWTRNEKGVCVPPVVKCPPGTTTKADGSCEAIIECPPGYTKNAEGKCIPPPVKTPEILCPSGYYKNANGDCVPSVTPTVPTTPKVPEILCPVGYYKNANGDCVPTYTPTVPKIDTTTVTPSVPKVETTVPKVEIPKVTPIVPKIETTVPKVEVTPSKICPDGYIKDEYGNCVKKDCPPGYTKNAQGYCVPDMTTQRLPDCPDGYTRNSATGICEPVTMIKDCPPGYKKDSNGNCTPSTSPGDCGCNNPKETIEYKKTIYDYEPTAKRNCENDDCDD